MKLNRITLTILAFIVITATVLSACAPSVSATEAPAVEATDAPAPVAATEAPDEIPAAEPVTLQYWHTHSDAEAAQLDEVIAAFEAANPDIFVESTRYAYGDFKTALLTAIASGAVPDVARLDIAWVSAKP
jgi:ABC-type glycerol-3-phosphate transport system substrate-binding protein